MHVIETTYDIRKGLQALNALDINGAKMLPIQFTDLSIEALDILSGGETSWIIELNRSMSKVQRIFGSIETKAPLLTPFILMIQSLILHFQMILVNLESSSPKYDYFWAAVAAYYKVVTPMRLSNNKDWGKNDDWGKKNGAIQSGNKNFMSNQNPFALKQISKRNLLSNRKIRQSY